MATAFTASRVAYLLNQSTMKQDLITLSEQFPGLTVTVSLDDLLTAGRKLSEEIVEGITRERDAIPALPASAEELLTKEETCQKLGVSGTTLWRWAQNGYLSPAKVGVQIRYRLSDIASLIARKGGAL